MERRADRVALEGPWPRRLGAALGERRRQGRLLLHPRRAGARRRKRRRREDLRRPRRRRLSAAADPASLRGLRRVPRRRHAGRRRRRTSTRCGAGRRRLRPPHRRKVPEGLREAARQMREEAPPPPAPSQHRDDGTMAEQTKSKERSRMQETARHRRVCSRRPGLRSRRSACPAQASQPISFFKVNTTNTDGGRSPRHHDRIHACPTPAAPEVAKTIEANWPHGRLRQPAGRAALQQHRLRPERMPVLLAGRLGRRPGPLRRRSEFHIFGSAPLYDMEPAGEDETARFAFTVPGRQHPDHHPDQGAHRLRLRPHARASPASPSRSRCAKR